MQQGFGAARNFKWVMLAGVFGLVVIGLTAWLIAGTNSNGKANPAASVTGALNTGGEEYLALGDSVAYGTGASSPRELGYAGVFYQQYLKPARPQFTEYRNLAIPGETAGTFISRASSQSQLEQALAELDQAKKEGRNVGIISLTIGGNDVLGARTKSTVEKQATLDQYDANLQIILKKLTGQLSKNSQTRTTLVLTDYYNPFTDSSASELGWASQFNDLIKKRAAEYGAKLAEFYDPFVGQETSLTRIAQGDIHPNQAGHARLAAQVWQAVR